MNSFYERLHQWTQRWHEYQRQQFMNTTDNLGRTLFIRGNIDMNTKDTLGLTHIINAILI